MQARMYIPWFGRFGSPDPGSDQSFQFTQKWNIYSYVSNNPVMKIDPNGMEEVTVTYRTFIPQSKVTVLGKHFAGDGRGFSTAPAASSRTSITVRLETDASKRPGNPIISVTSGAGASIQLDDKGNPIRNETATKGLPTATGSRDANGNPVINIQQDTKNPLSPVPQVLTPGITADLNVTIPQDASSAHVTGKASQFPAEEMNVTRADGNTTAVYQSQPPADATPFSLMKPDQKVDVQKPTPKKEDEKK